MLQGVSLLGFILFYDHERFSLQTTAIPDSPAPSTTSALPAVTTEIRERTANFTTVIAAPMASLTVAAFANSTVKTESGVEFETAAEALAPKTGCWRCDCDFNEVGSHGGNHDVTGGVDDLNGRDTSCVSRNEIVQKKRR